MLEPVPDPSDKPRDNRELQRVLLRDLQARMSNELFEAGVVSRLAFGSSDKPVTGARIAIEGFDQLDKTFVPAIGFKTGGDRRERVLQIIAIEEDAKTHGRGFRYFDIGTLDDVGIVYPYHGIDPSDAELVARQAAELEATRSSGEMPNLSTSLLEVFDPSTAIMRKSD